MVGEIRTLPVEVVGFLVVGMVGLDFLLGLIVWYSLLCMQFGFNSCGIPWKKKISCGTCFLLVSVWRCFFFMRTLSWDNSLLLLLACLPFRPGRLYWFGTCCFTVLAIVWRCREGFIYKVGQYAFSLKSWDDSVCNKIWWLCRIRIWKARNLLPYNGHGLLNLWYCGATCSWGRTVNIKFVCPSHIKL